MRLSSFTLARALVLSVSFALVWAASASAAVWTDQPDYAPGSVVTISGDNSNDAGYLAGEAVHVDVSGPNGWTSACDATADDAGAWSCQVTLGDGGAAVGDYTYTATGLDSGTTENGSFTDSGVFVRAATPGPTYVSVTFVGDGVGGNPDDILTYFSADCTGAIDKYLPANEITNTDGTYDLADGMSNIGSVLMTAPSPITVGTDNYVFSNWTFSNATAVGSSTDNPGCFTAPNTDASTFFTANYVPADPDLTATKTNDTSNDFAGAGDTFTWTIRVENEDAGDAVFADTEVLLVDDLPSGPTYDNVVVTTSAGWVGNDPDCAIVSDTLTCTADGATTIASGEYFDVSVDVTPGFGQAGTTLDNPPDGGTCAADPGDVVDESDETNNACSDSVGVTAIVVTRGSCTFDLDSDPTYETFRNVFTPDMNTGDYKLFSTNPGQFFLNVATYIDQGETVTVTLPFPFVTQGAVPIKVYGDWSVTEDGKTCISPSNLLWSQTDQVTIDDYNGTFGDQAELEIVPPDSEFTGWVLIRIHIDYGLKGLITGCTKDGDNPDADAIDCVFEENTGFDIWDGQTYTFEFSDAASGSTTIDSDNEFKRVNGVAGLILGAGGEPVAGATIQVWQGSTLWKTVTTDGDGWYMALFKYHGKATTFTVQVITLGIQQSFTLKSNGFAVANFIEGVSTWEFITDLSSTTSTGSGGSGGGGGGGKGKR